MEPQAPRTTQDTAASIIVIGALVGALIISAYLWTTRSEFIISEFPSQDEAHYRLEGGLMDEEEEMVDETLLTE